MHVQQLNLIIFKRITNYNSTVLKESEMHDAINPRCQTKFGLIFFDIQEKRKKEKTKNCVLPNKNKDTAQRETATREKK